MEAAVLAAGGDLNGAAYVMSPHAYKISKSLAAVSSVSALFDGGQFNGYRPVATKHLADITADTIGQMIFGNFGQGLILAFFSGIDILVDPFTSASNAQITLHVNRYFDTGFDNVPDVEDEALNRVQVSMTVGYAEADVPKPLIQAVKLMTAHLYETRIPVVTGTITSEVPLALKALLNPYRVL